MIKLKDEYKTAVIGGFDGKHRIEMLFCDPRLYPLIAKDFPHFFYEEGEVFSEVKEVESDEEAVIKKKK